MIASGRCGWYLRTLEAGLVSVRGSIDLVQSDPSSPTVAEAFAVMFPNLRPEADDVETVGRVLAAPALAPEWVRYLRARNPGDDEA
jgi:MOSC domain-containing protein YiiM